MSEAGPADIGALAKGGRTNIAGFGLRLVARLPFLFIAGRIYGADLVGRFALAVIVVELAALVATFGLKRGWHKRSARPNGRMSISSPTHWGSRSRWRWRSAYCSSAS